MSKESNKRLAKNTLALYFRTFVTLLVSLYISRVVLRVLGVTDFGIYNVVGSVVMFFSFLSSSLSVGTQRFLTFELGRDNINELKRIFSMSLTSMFSLALFIVFFAETIGLWFVNHKLNIPADRLYAAKWAYQLSIFTFFLGIIRTPYRAAIISYEKMNFFAYISIFEAFIKLGLVFLLQIGSFDRLIFYAVLLTLATGFIDIVYWLFCKRKFVICNYFFYWDKNMYFKLVSFSGWNLMGSGTNIASQNGLAFLINIFWGVTLNASLGIANQVSAGMSNFVTGFETSFVPQIVKAYAQDRKEELEGLINRTSKFSFMLVFVPASILMVNMPLTLRLWLHTVPKYTVAFSIWILITKIIDATTAPYYAAIMATGNIKRYEIAISISFTLDLVFSFMLIKIGISPKWIFVSRVVTRGILNMLIGLRFLKIQIEFNLLHYFKKVIMPIIYSILLMIPIFGLIKVFTFEWQRLIFSLVAILTVTPFVFYKILLNNSERTFLKNALTKVILRK